MQWFVQTADGRTLAVEDAGDRAGRPVLVHVGTPNSRRLYGRTVADATARGLRLISYIETDTRPTRRTSTAPAPDRTAWMPRSCRSRCMVAASTSYEAHAGRYQPPRHRDPDPAAPQTPAAHRARPFTVKEADRSLSYGDMAAATIRSCACRARNPGQ